MKDIFTKALIVLKLLIFSALVAAKEGWDFLVFAQQWPPAVCATQKKQKCVIPEGVDGWTIHGLWPTDKKGYPTFCNNSWPFEPSSIQPIIDALKLKWPNLFSKTSEYSFWKHEWKKHGTCAASDDQLKGELKYFGKSIELRDEYNLYALLQKVGFFPCKDKPFVLKYVENALTLQLNKKIKIACTHEKAYQYPLLTSINVCIDKNFDLIDCEDKLVQSCNSSFITYLPYPDEKELTECGCMLM